MNFSDLMAKSIAEARTKGIANVQKKYPYMYEEDSKTGVKKKKNLFESLGGIRETIAGVTSIPSAVKSSIKKEAFTAAKSLASKMFGI